LCEAPQALSSQNGGFASGIKVRDDSSNLLMGTWAWMPGEAVTIVGVVTMVVEIVFVPEAIVQAEAFAG